MKTHLLLVISLFAMGCAKDMVQEDLGDLLSSSTVPLQGGTWTTGCLASQGGGYQKRTASFSGGSYKAVQYVYSDYCMNPHAEVTETGTYTLPGSSKTQIDFTMTNATVKPISVQQVTSLNNVSYCGVSDWSSGVEVSLMGKFCNGIAISGVTYYDIYYIEPNPPLFPGSNPGDMKFGNPNTTYDRSAPAKRPAALNGNIVYRK